MGFDFIDRKFVPKPNLECEETSPEDWEEGGNCPSCKALKAVEIAHVGDSCTCFSKPPCGYCTSAYLQCSKCLEQEPN